MNAEVAAVPEKKSGKTIYRLSPRIRQELFHQMGYEPSPIQLMIHNSKSRFRVVAAGARSGKSMLAGFEIAVALLLFDTRIWCVSTQYELAEKEFDWAVSFLEKLKLPNGKSVLSLAKIKSAARGSKSLSFPWKSFVQTKSCEKPQTLLGVELDFLVLCEAAQLSRTVWERMLRARIGPRRGKMLATSTPNADGGLFYSLFETAGNTPNWERWQYSTLENPYFSRMEYALASKELDSKVFAEQYEGKFISRRGKVFNLNSVSIVDKSVDETLPVMVGIHYRSNNPTAIVFISIDVEKRIYYVYDEIYGKNTWTDYIPELKKRLAGKRCLGFSVDYFDSAIQAEAKKYGLSLAISREEKKIGRILAATRRIQGVQNLLKVVDDKSRLRISRSCTETIREIDSVKWPDCQKEDADKTEHELPLSKYMSLPNAISYVVSFCETVRGIDFYRVQGQ
jgi:hypothetical protein